jgi:hypothetical protein
VKHGKDQELQRVFRCVSRSTADRVTMMLFSMICLTDLPHRRRRSGDGAGAVLINLSGHSELVG